MKQAGSGVPRCSFCHKGEEAVKLVSSPDAYQPRVYICKECIAVCDSILSFGESVNALHHFVAAINQHDPSALAALMTDDHVFVDSTSRSNRAIPLPWRLPPEPARTIG